MKNRELAYQEVHDLITSTDKFKSEGPVNPTLLRDFSGMRIERDNKGNMKYEWVKDSKGKWEMQDYDPTAGRDSEIAYTDAHGNFVHPEDPIRVLEDLGTIYHDNWKKADGSLDTEALDKLKKIGFTTEEIGRFMVGNDRMSSKNTNTNTLAKEFPDYFNKEKNSDTPKERQNIKTSTPQYKYFIDDFVEGGFGMVNQRRGTNFTIEDEKKAIESYFEEGRNLDETDKVNNQLKEILKSRKKSHPDLFGDIVDDEGNYIGSSKATPSEGAAFKFGDNETSNKVATDPNIPWKDFMQGNWTYEGEECNMKGKCPSDDDRDGARRTIGSMVYMDDFPRISKESDENMSAETFIERVNTEGTKENKLWKTAMLPMPATMAMINTRYKK
jgi:hypothetical protein